MVTTKALNLFDNFNVNQLTPYAVGFDRVFDRLVDYTNNNMNSTGFPPYNIRKVGDYGYEIEMALAGFGKDDIEVEVANGVLTVRSVKENSDEPDVLHRGISYRKFNRRFTLADDIVVSGAKLENGLLLVQLEQVIPEEKKPRLIDIK
jgi:molecular chaperone IbpA